MPLQAGPQWGKDVLFEAWADGAYLRYNVIDPTDAVRNMCGFAGKGTDVYFSGNADNGDELFKMDAAGVVTRIGSLYASAIKAKIVGDKYYYWDDSDNNLWVYDLAADVETKLTGSNESLVEDGNIDELVFNGNKVYFTSDAKSDGYTHLWVVDLAKATYEEKMITPVANFTSDNYDKLVPNGTDVFFDYEGVNNEGRELYKISATDVVTKVDGFDAEGYGWLYGLTSNGTDILATYHVDSTNSQVVIRYAGGTTKSVLNFGADNKIECAAFAGNEVMASTQTGQALYYNSSTGAVQDAGFSFGNNNWAPCDAVLTSVGSFMYLSEYGYNGGPWDAEIGYVGTLIPWASKRLGVSVSEAPSAPAGYLPDANAVKPGAISGLTATAGSGVVNLSWTAPSVGTTPRYAVTSTPAGAYCVVTGTTAACTGTAGVSYTFTVVAANDAGVSAGVTSAAVKMPGAVVTPPKVDTDNPNLSALTETKTFKGTKGSVVFADGSGFDIDAKGRIFSKLKSKYLTSISGSIVATYVAGGKNKTFTCKLKTYGSVKKLKTLPRNAILYKSKQACQLPAAAITSLKAGKLTIVQKVLVKRYYATTAKDVDSKTKKKIKAMNRKMTVKFTK